MDQSFWGLFLVSEASLYGFAGGPSSRTKALKNGTFVFQFAGPIVSFFIFLLALRPVPLLKDSGFRNHSSQFQDFDFEI